MVKLLFRVKSDEKKLKSQHSGLSSVLSFIKKLFQAIEKGTNTICSLSSVHVNHADYNPKEISNYKQVTNS